MTWPRRGLLHYPPPVILRLDRRIVANLDSVARNGAWTCGSRARSGRVWSTARDLNPILRSSRRMTMEGRRGEGCVRTPSRERVSCLRYRIAGPSARFTDDDERRPVGRIGGVGIIGIVDQG